MRRWLLAIGIFCIFCLIGCAKESEGMGTTTSETVSIDEMRAQYESMMAKYESERSKVPDYIKELNGEMDIKKETKSTIKESVGAPSDKKYKEGQYKIGLDIPAGEYIIFADSRSGYFCLSSDSNGNDIIANKNFEYNNIIYVNEGEFLELSRSYAVPIDKVDELPIDKATMFKVGVHLPAGEYKLIGSGYYCIYNDNRQDDIESNHSFKNQAYITVRDGQYLSLKGCSIQQ